MYKSGRNLQTTCPDGQYSASGSISCAACSKTCATCINAAGRCTSCVQANSRLQYYSVSTTDSKALACNQCAAALIKNGICCYKYDPSEGNNKAIACDYCTAKNRCPSCTGSQVWSDDQNACVNSSECQGTVNGKICDPCVSPKIFIESKKTCGVVSECTNGIVNGIVCKSCPAACSTKCELLDKKTVCPKTCPAGQFLMEDDSCSPGCKTNEGYYKVPSSIRCNKCHTECLSCTGNAQNQCLVCTKEYNINTTTKLCECDTSKEFFLDGSGFCKKCSDNCKTCTQFGEDKCTDCKTGLNKNKDAVCIICLVANGQFIDSADKICKPCFSACKTCTSEAETSCTSCKEDNTFVYDDGRCQLGCVLENSFYVFNTNYCKPCHASCKTCTAGTDRDCSECKNNYQKVSNRCSCSLSGWFLDIDGICKQCHSSCDTCTGTKRFQCKTCNTDYTLFPDNTCYFCDTQNGWFTDSNSICQKCDPSCATCSGSTANDCLTCPIGKGLNKSGSKGNCATDCNTEQGFYMSGSTCTPCVAECRKCIGAGMTNCQNCASYIYPKNSGRSRVCNVSGSQCDSTKGNYVDFNTARSISTTTGTCLTTCRSPKLIIPMYTPTDNAPPTSICIDCPTKNGYYLRAADNVCDKCSPNCLECSDNSTKCIVCIRGYFQMPDGTCIQKCPNTHAATKDSYCIQCPSKCTTGCDEDDSFQIVCTLKCGPGEYIYDDETCKIGCDLDNGYYLAMKDTRCKKCHANCLTCTGFSEIDCKNCVRGYSVDPTSKKCTCPSLGFVVVQVGGSDFCKPCHKDCQTCSGEGKLQCLTCADGYDKFDDQSCAYCDTDNGYFLKTVGSQKICTKCIDGCASCTSESQTGCTKCFPGFAQKTDKTCIECQTENGFVMKSNTCQPCNSQCRKCTDTTATTCTHCPAPNDSYAIQKSGSTINCTRNLCDGSDKYIDAVSGTCKTCSQPKIIQYIKQDNTQYSKSGNCITCPTRNGYFNDGTNCLPCASDKCQECTDAIGCLICRKPYFLKSETQTCVDSCGDNFFGNPERTCEACPTNCKVCEINTTTKVLTCLTCIDKFALLADGTCISCDIKNNNYIDTATQTCKNCDSSCQTCNGDLKTNCLTCAANKYKYLGECIPCDQPGFSIVGENCIKCHESCLTCKDDTATGCIKCINDTLTIYEDSSCKICPTQHFFIDTTTSPGVCKPCHDNCLECTGSSETDCKLCDSSISKYLFKASSTCGECLVDSGYFIANSNTECQSCHPSCLTCNSSSSNTDCKKCKDGKKIDLSNVCNDCDLSSGFYVEAEYCKQCDSSCKTCSKEGKIDSCIECNDGLYKHENLECKECLEDNGVYVNSSKICTPCSSSCKTCFGGNNDNCKTCNGSDKLMEDKTCGQCQINNGYFISGDNCLQCDSSCSSCSGKEKSECIECKLGLNKNAITGLCEVCDSLKNMYISDEDNKCYQCDTSCNNCTSKLLTSCVECRADLYRMPDLTCQPCPETNFFIDGKNCKNCDNSCLKCNTEAANSCTTCISGKFLYDNSTCGDCTELKHYKDVDTQQCSLCDPSCKTCTGKQKSECLECSDGLNKNAVTGLCEVCDINNNMYIKDTDKKCYQCDESCINCGNESLNSCVSCRSDLKRMPDLTCQTCPETNYFVEGEFCKNCNKSCLKCKNELDNSCTACPVGKFLYENGTCGDCNDPLHYKDTVAFKCEKCHISCKTCNGKLDTQCIECQDGLDKKLDTGLCEGCDILNNKYISDEDNKCYQCDASCNNCTSKLLTSCVECRADLYRMPDLTCQACPENNFFIDGKNCKNCDNSCLKCNNQAANSCTACIAGKFLYDNSTCGDCTELKHYKDVDTQSCKLCDPSCKTCSGKEKSECLECSDGLNKNAVTGLCEVCDINNNMYINDTDKKCYQCDATCVNCTNESLTSCVSCRSDLKRMPDLTCQVCPEQNYFKEGDQCKQCHANCLTCNDQKSTSCILCQENKYLYEDSSCGDCSESNFFQKTESSQKKCIKCHDSCENCTGKEANECIKCKDTSQFFDQNRICVSDCEAGFIKKQIPSKSTYYCSIICGQNSIPNDTNTLCQCLPNHEPVLGSISDCQIKCGQNSENKNLDECQCKSGFRFETSSGSSSNQRDCEIVCGKNAINSSNLNKCDCNVGYAFIEHSEIECGIICGANAISKTGSTCDCVSDEYKLDTATNIDCNLKCLDNSEQVDRNTCKCLTGFNPVNDKNTQCQIICDGFTTPSSLSQCKCQDGYEQISDSPLKCGIKCGSHANRIGDDECGCDSGYQKINGSKTDCQIICDDNAINDGPDKCICQSNEFEKVHGSDIKCQIICGKNSVPKDSNSCKCLDNYEPVPGSEANCQIKCGQNAENKNLDECECKSGFRFETSSGSSSNQRDCEIVCGKNAINSSNLNKCDCNLGYAFIEHSEIECGIICGANAKSKNGTTCDCVSDDYQLDSGTNIDCNLKCLDNSEQVDRNTCKCLTGFNPVNDKNTQCQIICDGFTTPSSLSQCKCQDGYEQISDSPLKCGIKCGSHSNRIGDDECGCDSGYKKVDGSKRDCQIICGENAINDGPDKCICKNNEFEKVSGSDIKCQIVCGKNSVPKHSNSCKCIDNYDLVPGSSANCQIKCGDNAINDGLDKCICKNIEFQKVPGSEIQCQIVCGKNSLPKDINSCECIDNYEPVPGSSANCQIKCSDNAINDGTDKCKCKNNEFEKVPGSDIQCQIVCGKNSLPKDINSCKCIDNYDPVPGSDANCQIKCGDNAQNTSDYTKCECLKGYKWEGASLISCEISCGNHAYQTDKNTCGCDSGYELVSGQKSDCQIICGLNQSRKGLNECECIDGYEFKDSSKKECIKSLIKCGINEERGSDNTCKCKSGYQYNNKKECSIICGNNSINSSLNECKCVSEEYVYIDNTKLSCRLDCKENSHVANNDKCECNGGFKPLNKNNSKCQIQCGDNAVNIDGNLIECKCKLGYSPVSNSVTQCQINCGTFSERIDNSHCKCQEGYKFKDNSQIDCQLSCGKFSFNQGDKCACNKGYKQLNERECQIVCEENSVQESQYKCQCNQGYSFVPQSESKCQITCETNAVNETLYKCICKKDFVSDKNIDGIDCSIQCGLNSTKLSKDKCQCIDGFEFKEGSQIECIEITTTKVSFSEVKSYGVFYAVTLTSLVTAGLIFVGYRLDVVDSLRVIPFKSKPNNQMNTSVQQLKTTSQLKPENLANESCLQDLNQTNNISLAQNQLANPENHPSITMNNTNINIIPLQRKKLQPIGSTITNKRFASESKKMIASDLNDFDLTKQPSYDDNIANQVQPSKLYQSSKPVVFASPLDLKAEIKIDETPTTLSPKKQFTLKKSFFVISKKQRKQFFILNQQQYYITKQMYHELLSLFNKSYTSQNRPFKCLQIQQKQLIMIGLICAFQSNNIEFGILVALISFLIQQILKAIFERKSMSSIIATSIKYLVTIIIFGAMYFVIIKSLAKQINGKEQDKSLTQALSYVLCTCFDQVILQSLIVIYKHLRSVQQVFHLQSLK